MKQAALILITYNKYILAVSRKHDHNDFGLPGGKVDPGETIEQAAIRELKEETNLDLIGPEIVYIRFDGEYQTSTVVGKWSGKIRQMESGLVEWVSPQKLIEGSFGDYNKNLFEKLGIN